MAGELGRLRLSAASACVPGSALPEVAHWAAWHARSTTTSNSRKRSSEECTDERVAKGGEGGGEECAPWVVSGLWVEYMFFSKKAQAISFCLFLGRKLFCSWAASFVIQTRGSLRAVLEGAFAVVEP